MHFVEDVAAPDEFAIDVELGIGGPFAVNLHLLPDDVILQDINGLVVGDAVFLQNLHHEVGIPAAGGLWVALHEQDYLVILDPLVD